MKRIHLFELEDLKNFPPIIRNGITDYLEFASNKLDIYKPIIPIIEKALKKSKTNRIIDLCSGGGGGIVKIQDRIDAKITLTDLYPNLETFEKLSEKYEKISCCLYSVNAITQKINYNMVAFPYQGASSENLKHTNALRTIFVGFHHFKPEDAEKLLETIVQNNHTILIVEATERTLINFIIMFFTPIVVMLATLFMPFSWEKFILTFILPLIPLATMWDGLVSVLRTYSPKEIDELTKNFTNYTWETKRVTSGNVPLIYTLGYPK